MKVGDLVKGTPASSPEYGKTTIGIVVGTDLDGLGRIMVQWSDMPKPYPEPRHYLKVLIASR